MRSFQKENGTWIRGISDSISSRVLRTIRRAASNKGSAFTIAELIVIISILAVLAIIGFLAFSGYSDDAKSTAVKANVQSVYLAISSESAISANSPRYYVVHDSSAALSGAIVVIDGNSSFLTGGNWNEPNTNYSAGNPDYEKLKLDPDKFRVSSLWSVSPDSVFAAYDPKLLLVGATDLVGPEIEGKRRKMSFLQVAGLQKTTGEAVISGNYPNALSGSVLGLIRDSAATSLTGALVNGIVTGGPASCSAVTASGFSVPDMTSGEIRTLTRTIPYGTESIRATCSVGSYSYDLQSVSCDSGYVEGVNFTCIADICGGSVSDVNAHATATSQSVSANWTRSDTAGLCTWDCNEYYSWDGASCSAIIPEAPTAVGTVRCWAGTATVTATAPTGSVVDWYAEASGGTPLASGTDSYSPDVSTTTTFYAESRNSTTEAKSATRTAVIATVDVPPVGGTATWETATVSEGSSMTMNLSGQSGTIDRWQHSVNGGEWIDFGNAGLSSVNWGPTDTSYNGYSFRAVLKNGSCAETYSAATGNATVTPGAPTAVGTVRCWAGTATITATAPTGSVVDWYSSASGGTPLASGANSYSPSISATTTFYAESRNSTTGVKSPSRTAAIAKVDTPPVGGTATWAAQRVCQGSSMTMNLSGQSGTIDRWQYSVNGGAWVDFGNAGLSSINWGPTTTSHNNYSFRAVLKNGNVCAETYSAATGNSTVDATTVGGTMTAGPNPVNYANNTTLAISGNVGSVQGWEYYYSAWTPWNVGTPTSVVWTAYPGYYFRALIKNGVCPAAYTSQVYVNVNYTYQWVATANFTAVWGNYYGPISCQRSDGVSIKTATASTCSVAHLAGQVPTSCTCIYTAACGDIACP